MTAPNLSVASATVPDINDKLNVIAGRIQNLDAQGNLDQPVFSGDYGVGGAEGLVPAPAAGDAAAAKYLKADGTWAAVPASGDVTGPAASVDSEVALFSGTTGKIIKRASATGIAKLTAGVLSAVTAPSGAIVGDTDAQTLTNKTLTTPTIASFVNATHTHQNAAGGGTLDTAAIASGTLAAARMPALTGDVTTSAGAVATTLATVNANVGSFGSSTAIPVATVNAKGLVTAMSTAAVVAPAGTLTGATLAAGVTTSSLTSFGTSPAFTGTPTAPTAAVDTNTTQIATTAMVLGQAAAATPLAAGTAAVGTSTRYARADHVHPSPVWASFTPTLTAATGTWTAGSFTNCKYRVDGKTLTVNFKITGSSVSATPLYLNVTIPNSYTSAGEMGAAATVSDNGTVGTAWVITASAGGTGMTLFKNILASANWAASAANTAVQFSITFEIQ